MAPRPGSSCTCTAGAPDVGDVAQLGEHLLCKQGSGFDPLISTRLPRQRNTLARYAASAVFHFRDASRKGRHRDSVAPRRGRASAPPCRAVLYAWRSAPRSSQSPNVVRRQARLRQNTGHRPHLERTPMNRHNHAPGLVGWRSTTCDPDWRADRPSVPQQHPQHLIELGPSWAVEAWTSLVVRTAPTRWGLDKRPGAARATPKRGTAPVHCTGRRVYTCPERSRAPGVLESCPALPDAGARLGPPASP